MSYYKNKSIKKVMEEFGMDLLDHEFEYEPYRFNYGQILNSGMFTMVAKLDYFFVPEYVKEQFDNPVLIISTEDNKRDLVEKLLNLNTISIDYDEYVKPLIEEWLEDIGFETEMEANDEEYYFDMYEFVRNLDIEPWIIYLENELGLNCFFMEQLESFNVVDSEIANSVDSMIQEIFPFTEGYGYNFMEIDYDIKELIQKSKEMFSTIDKNIRKKILNIFLIVVRDMKRAAQIMMNEYLEIDIHNQQFLKINNKIYCADPFTIK